MPLGDAPQYRVRLFLSVDLTGSTSFKSKNESFVWLKAFQEFYSEFPRRFSENYERTCKDIPGLAEHHAVHLPKIWKTIGDEILFVNRVYCVTHLGAYVTAFSKTLHEFGASVQGNHDLNTKGNGWIAAFPSPNCSIQVRSPDNEDPISGHGDLNTEVFEAAVDTNPENFDFLGKGIDSGFRIARNSTIDTFTISPALAFLLVKAKGNPDATKFDGDLVFHEPQRFKGVVGDRPYPVISIDTVRSADERRLKDLEAELLQKPAIVQEMKQLRAYLETYIDMRGIEMPCLKLSDNDDDEELPKHYHDYIKQWSAEAQKAISDLEAMQAQSNGDEPPVDEDLLSPESAASDLKLDKDKGHP